MDQNMSITIFSSVFYSGGSRPSDKGGGAGGLLGAVSKKIFFGNSGLILVEK